MEYKFLSLIVFVLLPLIPMFAILSPFFPNNPVLIRRFSKGFAVIHLVYALLFLLCFDTNLLSMSYEQELLIFNSSWIKTMGITSTFAVDALSLLLCVFTCFIFLIAFIKSKYSITSKHKLYYPLLFLLQTSILGVFCAKDAFLMFFFWLLELIPMYFLISIYGDGDNKKSATKYLMYMSFGSVFLLFSILLLYYYNFTTSGVLTANIDALSFDEYVYPVWLQIVSFSGFLICFLIKMAVYPFQLWYIDVQKNSPTPVNMLVSSVILSMGAYGLIRFNMQIFPARFKTFAVYLMILAVITIVCSGLNAYLQKNVKQIVSYYGIIQSGFIITGLVCVSATGLTGAIFHIFAQGLISAALFLICGLIYQRTKTLDIEELGGIAKQMPQLTYFIIPVCLGACAMPFTATFVSIFAIILSAFTTDLHEQIAFQIGAILLILSLIYTLVFVLKFLHKIFFGNMPAKFINIKDISISEFIIFLMLIIPIFILGFSPMVLVNIYNNVVTIIIDIIRI